VLTGDLLVVVVEEACARELGGPVSSIPDLEATRTVIDEFETTIGCDLCTLGAASDNELHCRRRPTYVVVI